MNSKLLFIRSDAERHEWLRSTVASELRDPVKFWEKLNILPTIKTQIPGKAAKALKGALPGEKLRYRVVHRVVFLMLDPDMRFSLRSVPSQSAKQSAY